MEDVNVICVNIYDIEDHLDNAKWKCCNRHRINVDIARNFNDLIDKLKQKKYDGLIVGNKPENASLTAEQIIIRARQLEGYSSVPAVILVTNIHEIVGEGRFDEREPRILVVAREDLNKEEKMFEIIHTHILGLNQ